MKIEGFDWDAGNSEKIRKHGLSTQEVESFFETQPWIGPDINHSMTEERFLAFGQGLNRRHVIVAFTFRMKKRLRLIRPISGRYMHEKEIRQYEEVKKTTTI